MSIITVAEAKSLIPSLESVTVEDTAITTEIDRADAALARRCGFGRDDASTPATATFASQSYTFFLRGDNVFEDGRVLQLPIQFVNAITKIEQDYTEVFDGTTYVVASSDYTLHAAKGRVLMKTTAVAGLWWDTPQRTIKATFTGGFVAVPIDIKRAVALQVASWFQARGSVAMSSMSLGAHAAATPKENAHDLLPEVLRLVSPFRCFRALT